MSELATPANTRQACVERIQVIFGRLQERQQQILTRLNAGESAVDIAASLELSFRDLAALVQGIFARLDIKYPPGETEKSALKEALKTLPASPPPVAVPAAEIEPDEMPEPKKVGRPVGETIKSVAIVSDDELTAMVERISRLTPRELRILALMARGLDGNALREAIGHNTIAGAEAVGSSIRNKLGIRSKRGDHFGRTQVVHAVWTAFQKMQTETATES